MLNIIDPLTNNTYNLFSKLGKTTLKRYIMQCQNGGSMKEHNHIDFTNLRYKINNSVYPYRKNKYIDTLEYLKKNNLKIQYEISGKKGAEKIRVFIEHQGESMLEDEDDSEFALIPYEGAWNFDVMTNENHLGKGIARFLHFILITLFYNIYKYDASAYRIIGIDVDASGGFWDYLNLNEGRYGIDTYRADSKVITTGFEKQTTLQQQYQLAIGWYDQK